MQANQMGWTGAFPEFIDVFRGQGATIVADGIK